MRNLNRRLGSALLVCFACLMAFIGFSKAGLIFTEDNSNIITVTATERRFDPNNYVAAMKAYALGAEEEETTTTVVETTTTTALSTTTTTSQALTTTTTQDTTRQGLPSNWTGSKLTKSMGVNQGPSGKETYYNLDMRGVVSIMRRLGYSEEEYPEWVREDGVKMLGDYVMVAANLDIRPKGTILESSLGMAIVCDTGSFATGNPTQLDIAVSW